MKRVSNVIRDAMFTCNTRLLYDAYQVDSAVPTYMMQFSLFQLYNMAVHATDLLPTFWNSQVAYTKSLHACFNVGWAEAGTIAGNLATFSPPYQSYFASHAVTGDPNTNAIDEAKAHTWQTASVDNGSLINVVDARNTAGFFPTPNFTDITDSTNSAASCDFWKGIAAAIQSASGKDENLGLTKQDASVRGSNEL